jgi:hypothetical protein
VEHDTHIGDMRNAHKILIGKSEGKRQLKVPMYGWDYNIKVFLKDTGYEGVGWIHVAQVRTSNRFF